MRKIKFRAWDKVENRMRYENDVEGSKERPSLFAVGFHGLPINIDADSFSEHEIIGWNRDHNLFLMQFTGLKDKNGKDIYEGDIVKNNGYRELCIVEFYQGQYIGRYKPQDRFYPLDESLKVTEQRELHYIGLGFYVRERNSIEVIGNIYENPELLKADGAL